MMLDIASLFHQLNLVVYSEDEQVGLREFVENGFVLSRWMGLKIVFYIRAEKAWALQVQINEMEVDDLINFEILPVGRNFVETVADALDCGKAELGILQLSEAPLARGKIELIERCRTPFLFLPKRIRLQWPPFLSIFIPMSGEHEFSPALSLGLNLANILELDADLLHIEEEVMRKKGNSLQASLKDSYPHEYPFLVDEFLARASPFSSCRDWACVRNFSHLKGDVANLISLGMKESDRRLLVFEWKGSFDHGHAQIVKQLLSTANFPMLLVKQEVSRRTGEIQAA